MRGTVSVGRKEAQSHGGRKRAAEEADARYAAGRGGPRRNEARGLVDRENSILPHRVRSGQPRDLGFDFYHEVRQKHRHRENPQPDEDGVDGVAAGTGETVAFEEAVGPDTTDDRLDCGPSAQLSFDGRRP